MEKEKTTFARGHEVRANGKLLYSLGTRFIFNNDLLGKVYLTAFKDNGEIFLSGEFENDKQLAGIVNCVSRLFSKTESWEESLNQLSKASLNSADLPGQLLGLLSGI